MGVFKSLWSHTGTRRHRARADVSTCGCRYWCRASERFGISRKKYLTVTTTLTTQRHLELILNFSNVVLNETAVDTVVLSVDS